ncbi:hypothetical protein AVEN_122799-1 [Araneus ventricosus]|uniref:Uncharacterized protein n=1 Tax=Araneus ventricosus TaxID=182803 RepID=A0A4Y2JVC5_ARAVE|nr:hypothetical protein AVEN_122799-1 [Araneus ventricosus]
MGGIVPPPVIVRTSYGRGWAVRLCWPLGPDLSTRFYFNGHHSDFPYAKAGRGDYCLWLSLLFAHRGGGHRDFTEERLPYKSEIRVDLALAEHLGWKRVPVVGRFIDRAFIQPRCLIPILGISPTLLQYLLVKALAGISSCGGPLHGSSVHSTSMSYTHPRHFSNSSSVSISLSLGCNQFLWWSVAWIERSFNLDVLYPSSAFLQLFFSIY